jgi:hypothetical protein
MSAKVGSKVERPILVTGAAGRVGAVGRGIVELLRGFHPSARHAFHVSSLAEITLG